MNTLTPKAPASKLLLPFLLLLLLACAPDAHGQGTAFKYEGHIPVVRDAPAAYDMEFKLYDSDTGGAQQGPALSFTNVTLAGDTYKVVLDFGLAPFAAGEPRFLEIGYRAAGSADPYALITPRDPVHSVPYAIRALSAATADDASKLGGAPAGDYVKTDDPRLSDAGPPAPGSDHYIRNQTAQQSGASFNIDGSGTAAGTLKGGIVDAVTQYDLGGMRVVGAKPAQGSLFVGPGAGQLSAGNGVTAVGVEAGASNTAVGNSFFGYAAGFANTTGQSNTFSGHTAGGGNTTGAGNSFYGAGAGLANSAGGANSYFGHLAGNQTKGQSNSFFGSEAGVNAFNGSNNSFFGALAGRSNQGFGNSFLGFKAGHSNLSGSANTFAGVESGFANSSGHENAFYGANAGRDNTAGSGNAYFGNHAGYRRQGSQNSIFGSYAGWNADTGSYNSFFGHAAGLNSYGDKNSFFGAGTGSAQGTGSGNAFFGYHAGILNTSGSNNVFVGIDAGDANSAGNNNVFVGAKAGKTNTDGAFNTYVGREAGGSASTFGAAALGNDAKAHGSNSTALGTGAKANAAFSTAVGTGAKANAAHTVVLGTAADEVRIPGSLVVTGVVAKGGGSFKIDHPLDPENKTLSHSFVESPDMMNVYNGNAVTDARGLAVVRLPEYFEALNRDFRYQLTVLGRFAQAIVLKEVAGNRFVIKTSRPGVKVSWQVTGVRQDAYANTHRIPVEESKPAAERGTFLHPDAFRRRAVKSPVRAAKN